MPARQRFRQARPRALAGAVLMIAMTLASAAVAGVFGDGDPDNGVEDGRRALSTGIGEAPANDWYRSAGTIHCDGAVRGSATLLDLSELAPGAGPVIATAAHVLFDLETGQPWSQCAFHYMGLGALPGYQAWLSGARLMLGSFDPGSSASELDSGADDWAFAALDHGWRPPVDGAGLQPATAEQVADGQGRLGLVAWDRGRGEISVVQGCQAVFSSPDDLGGGAWRGQLLDDCDSDGGASGGGMVASRNGRSLLVGIRGGAHWDADLWPPAQYPDGPPPGDIWHPRRHTNFARALDRTMLDSLAAWIMRLDGNQVTNKVP